MNIRTKLLSLILILGIASSSSFVFAQGSSTDLDKSIEAFIGDHNRVRQLITGLQQAVAKHNTAAVATLVHYPFKVKLRGRPAVLRTPQAFVNDYDRIITPAIASAIQKQKYETLFVNYQGAMFGDGEVWIAGYCLDRDCKQTDIKIKTIQSTTNPKR